jgi:uncharacterized protein YndB with AHSA1/START domain
MARTSRTIVKETEFAATPDKLFEAFVNPAVLSQWFVRAAATDPRPGGSWWFDFGDQGGGRISGHYVHVDPPSRLVWTWNEWNIDDEGKAIRNEPEGDPPWAVTVCDITITDLRETTGFKLVHYGYPDMPSWDDLYHGVDTGWDEELEKLRRLVESG